MHKVVGYLLEIPMEIEIYLIQVVESLYNDLDE